MVVSVALGTNLRLVYHSGQASGAGTGCGGLRRRRAARVAAPDDTGYRLGGAEGALMRDRVAHAKKKKKVVERRWLQQARQGLRAHCSYPGSMSGSLS